VPPEEENYALRSESFGASQRGALSEMWLRTSELRRWVIGEVRGVCDSAHAPEPAVSS
jgi:hypothetical protein